MKNTLLISFFVFIYMLAHAQLYTIGTPTHNTTLPALSSINSSYEDSRVQYVYSASELQAAGIPSDFGIEAIHLLIFDLPGESLSNFTISMKNSSTNSFTPTPTYDDELTTVYTAASIGSGDFVVDEWKQFDLTAPFSWDGTSNLLIQVCYDNPNGAPFGNNGGIYVFRDADNLNRSAYRYADLSSGCSHTGGNRSKYKAVIQLEKFCTSPNVNYSINHNPAICSDTEVFSLSGSELGVNYKLYDWSNSQIGATVPGTGSQIDFPSISSTDVYYVNAEGTGSICAGPFTMKDGEDFYFISMTNYSDPSNVEAGTSDIICEESSKQLNATADVSSLVLFSEDFESSFKFNVRNNGDNSGNNDYETWYWTTGAYPNGTGYARVNSDAYGLQDMDESLITPEFDGSNMSIITLEFDHNLPIYSSEIADVDVWNGSSWVNVASYTTEQGDNTTPSPASVSLDLSPYKNSRMKVRFRYYDANYEYWWIIDNISITGTPSANYSWNNASSLTNSSISNPIASPESNTTYTLTVEANGCEATDQLTISIQAKPTITSSPFTGANTCGELTYNISTDANDSEGTWNNTGVGGFDAANESSTTYTSNTFNEDVTLTWNQEVGACIGSTAEIVVQFNQPIESYEDLDNNSWIWGGLSNSEWGTAENWYKWDGFKWLRQTSSSPDISSNLYILSHLNPDVCVSTDNFTQANNIVINDLTVSMDGILNISNNLTLKGDLTNSGNISGGDLIFDGDLDQIIEGASSIIENITIDKSFGEIILNTPLTIQGYLKMINGNINNGTNLLTIGTSSLNDGSIQHTSGMINGALRRYFPSAASSKFFPVGNGNVIRDFTVDFQESPGLNQYLTASYVTGIPQDEGTTLYNGLPLLTSDNQLIQNYSEEGYWEINPTANNYDSPINTIPFEISLHMNNIENAIAFTSENEYANVRIIKSAGSNDPNLHHNSWTSLSHINAIGSNDSFYLKGSTSGFSFFNGGKSNGEGLPVELISFNGNCNGSNIHINWNTASEYNSSHFILEHSRDGVYWSEIDIQESAGISTEIREYDFIHLGVVSSTNYYRLLQVDIDGTIKNYNSIAVSCDDASSGQFAVYPNPSSGSFQIIIKNFTAVGEANLMLVSATGAKIWDKSIEIGNGINTFLVSDELEAGVYYLILIDKNFRKQVVKQVIK